MKRGRHKVRLNTIHTAEDAEPPNPSGAQHLNPAPTSIENFDAPLEGERRTGSGLTVKSSTVKTVRNLDSIKTSARTKRFIARHYPDLSIAEWSDWQWQLRSRIRKLEELVNFVHLSGQELMALQKQREFLPLGVTPYYMSLLNPDDQEQPLRRTVVPEISEFLHSPGEARDPLGEDGHSPVPGLVHRYPDRVLFLVSGFCSVYCRYCTRSRMMGNQSEYPLSKNKQWEDAIDYIAAHREVRDVLISGGDPLTLADEKLEYLLSRLRNIPHVEFVRLGTKVPVVLPQRITRSLVRMLRKVGPVWMSIHFTHPDELTEEVAEACGRLADGGVPLGSQTVLLKGINDNVETMKKLMHGLLKMRVRPYYLYQCDPILGSAHFRTPVSKGLEIIQGLRGHTTGYAVPHYVIDAPGGGGKIPLLPEYVIGRDGKDLVLRNFEGKTFRYPDQA